MNDYGTDVKRPFIPKDQFFTNATVEIGGTAHQICVSAGSAVELTSRFFAAKNELTAAYATYAPVPAPPQPPTLADLLACGLASAVARQDWDLVTRLSKGAALYLAGAVERSTHPSDQADDTCIVQSQTQATQCYRVTATSCACLDWRRHSEGEPTYSCKHRIARKFALKLQSQP